jgi:hypothetical protein
MTYETEEKINGLIDDLGAARANEAAAYACANSLAMAAPRPYSQEKMREFCDAGDRMQMAQARKWLALDRLRDAYQAFASSGTIYLGRAEKSPSTA